MKSRSGLTLPEIVITMGILLLVGGALIPTYLSTSRFTTDEQHRILVDVSASRTLQRLDELLRQGKAVLASATVNATPYTTDGTTLVFTLPSVLASGSLSPTAVDTGVIQKVGSDIVFHLQPDATSTRSAGTQTLFSDARDIYFRYNNPSPEAATAVSVATRTEQLIRSQPYTRSSLLYALFRNHP